MLFYFIIIIIYVWVKFLFFFNIILEKMLRNKINDEIFKFLMIYL